jgi:hypothetical protein
MTLTSWRPAADSQTSLVHSLDTCTARHRWTSEELDDLERCIVCGAQPLSPMYDGLEQHGEGRWKIDRCPLCRVGLLNPRPSPSAIAHAYTVSYPPYSQAAARPEPTDRREHLVRRLTDARLASYWGYDLPRSRRSLALLRIAPGVARATDRLIRMAPAPVPGARLLDVGCSHGAYVALMAGLGWDASGIEPDATAVGRARSEGLQVRQGTMTDLSPEVDGMFDHITIGPLSMSMIRW